MVNKNYREYPSHFRKLTGLCSLLLMVTVSIPLACAQQNRSDVEWLIDVLNLKQGSVVADIGAGSGDQTLALAEYVGSDGHVYSSELGRDSVQYLQDVVDSSPVTNVTVLEGHPERTNLPEECCDALFLRRVYHHFGNPSVMNKSMLQALRPGGRLAVIDFEPRGRESDDPAGRTSGSQHGVNAATVEKELTEAGFRLVSSEKRSGRNFYIVVEKPRE